jgi:hypothetical protein
MMVLVIRRRGRKTGKGLINSIINKLPFEAHLPGGYRFCGPGTRLKERMGQAGINPLDDACKRHDIAYSNFKGLNQRRATDRVLENRAWERFGSKDTTLGEKTAAWAVTTAMKGKRRLGGGL